MSQGLRAIMQWFGIGSMERFKRLIAVLAMAFSLGLTTPPSPAAAQAPKAYVNDAVSTTAIRIEERIRRENPPGQQKPSAQLKREAAAALGAGNPRLALALSQAAAVAEARDPEAWRLVSRAAGGIESRDYSERYEFQSRASGAAYLAYQRATNRQDEAAALALLAQAEARRQSWRSALDAYRASLDLIDNAAVRTVYGTLREQHGFRILEYKVDSDAATPRVCFQFSEPLASGSVDFAPFVTIAGKSGLAVVPESRQLCVEGLSHGERYMIEVREGLPSSVREALLRTASYEIYVRDRSAQVRFTGRNYVLPRTGQEGIPVVSVNADKVSVEVLRVSDRSLLPTIRSDRFLSQLRGYDAREMREDTATSIWRGTLDVRAERNRDVITAFPVLEAVGQMEPGVYVMTAQATAESEEDDWRQRATQWFVVSDIGLTALSAEDGLHVLARSLADAKPMAGIEVKLVARSNEVLGTAKTDARGHARFDAGLSRGAGGLAPGVLTAEDGKGDYGFLDLRQSGFDLSDRGVAGRTAPGALDAYVFTERGVYRSGETVQVTTLLRDQTGIAVSGLPLTLIVKRPDGVEYRRAVVADQGLGGRAFAIPLIGGAASGTWRVSAHADPKRPPLGEATFLVEDYVPERLEIELSSGSPVLAAQEPAAIDMSARYLYGAPGAGLEVTGEVKLQVAAKSALPALDGYTVGLSDEAFDAITNEIEGLPSTDAQGRARVSVSIPEGATNRPLEARIVLRAGEPGGRAVARTITLPIGPSGPVVGVRPRFDPDALADGAQAEFDVVLAGPDGALRQAQGLVWSLSRVERRWQWFNRDGDWAFDSTTTTRKERDGRVDVGAGAPGRIAVPVRLGSYRLDVKADGIAGAETSITFNVGWGGGEKADTPDILAMRLDKAGYAAGEIMQVRLEPRAAGSVTIFVVGEKVHEVVTLDVPAEGAVASLTVRPEWGASTYVMALHHRGLDQSARRMPSRSIGIAPVSIDREARALNVDLGAPSSMLPRGPLDLPVRIGGLQPGEEAYVTVAAVDVGILNLTRYEAPDPTKYFFGQRALGAELRDLYGLLIDGMQGTRGAIRSGGDDVGATLVDSPPTQEPMARYSGVVRVGADGVARIRFDIPAFNGTVRVMATAWARGRTGQASADVIVRDPVVVQATLPRFLNVGDQSRFHVAIDNVDGPAGDYVIDVDVRGPVILPADATRRTIRLDAKGRAQLTIPVAAAGLGTAVLDLRLTGGGIDIAQTLSLRVQPPGTSLVRRSVRPLEANGGTVTITSDLVADLVPGTTSVALSVSPLAALDVPALLTQLDRYPYGCTEQVVSRALPLLYVNRLATQEGLAIDGSLEERLRVAVERVLTRQGTNGSFGLWSVGYGEDLWLDAFVTDFLTRARERNVPVPQIALDQALDWLRNAVVNAGEVQPQQASGVAYAIYVLARNGRPVMGDLRYLADTKLSAFQTPLARGQLAAALYMLGDRGRSRSIFGAALDTLGEAKPQTISRPDYGSRLRDGAGLLTLLAEAGGGAAEIQRAGLVVEAARQDARFTSTQEQSWMVLAAQALAKEAENIRLSVDGKPHEGMFFRNVSGEALEAAPVRIENRGAAAARMVVSVSGNPAQPEPAISSGFVVERSYHRISGELVDISRVRQNERFVVVLKVTERFPQFGRLLLVDPLPAGLEIDNPKLVDGSTAPAFDWLKREVEPVTSEYRDDRFVAAFDRDGRQNQTAVFQIAYMVRAVSPGRYVHPGALIEDMYRPDRFGRSAFGSVEVSETAR